MDPQEHKQHYEGNTVTREIDVEAPTPGNVLCERSTDDWTDGAGCSPDHTDVSEILSSVPGQCVRSPTRNSTRSSGEELEAYELTSCSQDR